MKKVLIIGAIVLIIAYLIGSNSENTNITNDSRVYSSSWRTPSSEEIITIGRLLVKNDIKMCSEYHVKEITSNEYIIACTPDSKNWTYYTLWPNVDEKVYRVTDEMKEKLKAPY